MSKALLVTGVPGIGKMECCSPLFVEAVERLLESDRPLLGTIALHGKGFIAKVKEHPRVILCQVTPKNRDQISGRIVRWLKVLF